MGLFKSIFSLKPLGTHYSSETKPLSSDFTGGDGRSYKNANDAAVPDLMSQLGLKDSDDVTVIAGREVKVKDAPSFCEEHGMSLGDAFGGSSGGSGFDSGDSGGGFDWGSWL